MLAQYLTQIHSMAVHSLGIPSVTVNSYTLNMVNISGKKLPTDVWERLWNDCIDVIVAQDTNAEMEQMLTLLLTRAERIMLAKRVGVIVMLRSGCSVRTIATSLHLSPNTVWVWSERLERGEFKKIEQKLRTPATYMRFLATVEMLLVASMPPIAGRNRTGVALERVAAARKRGSFL